MTSTAVLKDASPEQIEAFVQVVILVAYADHQLTHDEEKLLVSSVHELAPGRLTQAELVAMMARPLSSPPPAPGADLPPVAKSKSWRQERARVLSAQLGDQTLRIAAFRLAAEVARVDNHVGLRESRVLLNLMTELGIEPALARELLVPQT